MYQKMVDTDILFFYDPIGTGADPSLSMRTTGNLEFLSQCAVTIVRVI